ncbi:MAG: hypothetical protein WCC65_01385, partial [Pseudonocardiaceae bacterium]
VWFLDAGTRSWARFDYQPGTSRWPVHQFGPRRLWDEVTAAYHHWEDLGRPLATQWRFTLTPDEQRVELPGTMCSGHTPAAAKHEMGGGRATAHGASQSVTGNELRQH